MELNAYFKAVLEEDLCAVVICNLSHEIVYMNPAAKMRYAKRGGEKLVGQNLLDCHNAESQKKIQRTLEWFLEDKNHNRMYTFYNEKENKDVYMTALRNEEGVLIGYYEKHEYRNRETEPVYAGLKEENAYE